MQERLDQIESRISACMQINRNLSIDIQKIPPQMMQTAFM